jgi:NitT/TauT family transport system ATP-binding protein
MTTQGRPKKGIQIEGLDLFYPIRNGRLQALKDVAFSVDEGEFVCILGSSGCGKSTLLYIIAGLLKPTHGVVSVNGKPVNGPGADRTMVFQKDAVFPWLTVEQNIEYGLKLKGMSATQRREVVDHYIDLVDLRDARTLYPRELSGGMRKRVDMARAFANNPDVLLMDEPFGMLDAMTKEHLQQSLVKIWSSTKKTVFFVTHDLEEALFLADRIVILEPRPGRVHSIIDVPFERPRDVNLKLSEDFQELRRVFFETMGQLVSYVRD